MIRTFLLTLVSATLACADDAPLPALARVDAFLAPPASEDAKPDHQGLAFITEASGFLLTSYPNLTAADGTLYLEFRVRLNEDPSVSHAARIIGVEPTIGIGILKIDPPADIAASVLTRDAELKPGAPLRAFAGIPTSGNPEPTLISGSITVLNTRECYQESLASTMFRTDLPLEPRSIGTPVFNPETGAVIAIYTGFKPQAVEGHEEAENEVHLLPIGLCLNIYESLKHKKSLESPWTGFSVRPLKQDEERFFPTARRHRSGIGIEYVWPDSPAERLGIRPDDLLLQLGHNRIESVADFQKWLYMYGVGYPVKLVILRNGSQLLTTDYTIEKRPDWAKPR